MTNSDPEDFYPAGSMSTPEQPDHEASKSSTTDEKTEKTGRESAEERQNNQPVGMVPGELEELREAFVRAESSRKRRALLGGFLVVVALAVFVWVMIAFGDTKFRPEVEKGEQNVLAETNDPVCRGVIEQVTGIGVRYFEQESYIERALVSNDRKEVLDAQTVLEEQREELAGVVTRAKDAVFRYDKSRAELERWLEFVDTEYGQLIRLAGERAGRLESGADAEQDAKAKQADVAARDMQGRALLAIHESFHSFRVWHSSSLHPCGRSASELIAE